jgi:hypothetical protein
MANARCGFERAAAVETEMPGGLPDTVDDGFACEMRVDRRGPGRIPFLGREQLLQFGPLRRPLPGRCAVLVLIKNGLGESAPAGVADEGLLLLRGGLPALLFEGFEGADGGNVGADLFLGAALADPV